MSTLAFAWRSLVRQPGRALLGVLGIAAVGALLFDMLLLSNGLVLSMRELLERAGFDLRVTATQALPGSGPRLERAADMAARLADLPEIDEAVPIRFATAELETREPHPPLQVSFFGADASRRRAWHVTVGRDLVSPGQGGRELLINDHLAAVTNRRPGDTIELRVSCDGGQSVLPAATFAIVGIAAFPFDTVRQMTAATTRAGLIEACGDIAGDEADLVLMTTASPYDAQQARAAVLKVEAGLAVATNAELVGRLDASGFSYFRQISAVLGTVTTMFGLLLISVLLTVSVNQRLGIIAALRAIGFSRRRVVVDVLWESALMVGFGGLLALPLGLALAGWLDRILKRIPDFPAELHFFVFEPRALGVHLAILTLTAFGAAIYPMWLVSRLPIAATLRNEVTS